MSATVERGRRALAGSASLEGVRDGVGPDRAQRGRGPTVALMIESDGPGGAENMLVNLAEGLRARGYGVLPILPRDGCGWLGGRLLDRGFRSETFYRHRTVDPGSVTRLAEVLRRSAVSLVHAHEFAFAVHGTGAARLLGIPSVITMHGSVYHEAKVHRRVALRWAATSSRALIAVSAATAKKLAKSLWLPVARVQVIPNGVPSPVGRGRSVRWELGVAPDERLILSVGNLYPVKGHRTLVRGLADLARRRPELRWKAAIAGRGEEAEWLRGFVRESGLGDRVYLLGFRDDVPDLLNACDVFVLPSLSEGLPLALLEAMLAGKPPVASAVGGVAEVIREGETGITVPPADPDVLSGALERLLDDPALQMRLGSTARADALSRFTLDAMVDAYEDVYGFRPPGGQASW